MEVRMIHTKYQIKATRGENMREGELTGGGLERFCRLVVIIRKLAQHWYDWAEFVSTWQSYDSC
jgi:hypothetical protein